MLELGEGMHEFLSDITRDLHIAIRMVCKGPFILSTSWSERPAPEWAFRLLIFFVGFMFAGVGGILLYHHF